MIRGPRSNSRGGAWPLIAAIALAGPACSAARSDPAPPPERSRTTLPAPVRDGGSSLAAAIATRRSSRSFARRPLDTAEVSQLLWAAQGVTAGGLRAAPSAGALFPLEVRLVDARGVWRYVPDGHALAREHADDRRGSLARAGFDQQALLDPPAIVVIGARVAVTARKYGPRAERYCALEAGHAAQNLLLTATALGLAAVPVGAFDDAAVRRSLALEPDLMTLYLIPVGAPGGG